MKSLTDMRNLGLATLASLTLGGCYYGDVYGASYASADCSSRYGASYWSNDPFAYDDGYYGYDCYDAADYGTGFVQIGFGGGWYQQLYYPGYGMFLFDRYGRRHNMGHDYLTYWGGRRAWWKHHGHRYGNDGYRRGSDGRHDGRRDGRRPGRGYGQDGSSYPGSSDNNWSNNPPAAIPPQRQRTRGEGWRGRPRGDNGGAPIAPQIIAPDAHIAPPSAYPDIQAAPAQPPRTRRGESNGWGGRGAGQGGGNWSPPADAGPPVSAAPPPPRIPRYSAPTIGNDGATVSAPRMVPPQRTVPETDYSPPPPPRDEAPNREGAPIRED